VGTAANADRLMGFRIGPLAVIRQTGGCSIVRDDCLVCGEQTWDNRASLPPVYNHRRDLETAGQPLASYLWLVEYEKRNASAPASNTFALAIFE